MRVGTANGVRHPFLIAALAAAVFGGACNLDKSSNQQLAGPSETGLSAQMTAYPDLVNADGISTAVIDMVLRDSNGKPVTGRAVLFCTTPAVPDPLGGQPPDITLATCDSSTSAPSGFGNPATLNPQAGYTFEI